MPYIKFDRRILFAGVDDLKPTTSGELNYLFTKLAINYLMSHPYDYETINAIKGAFTCASDEFTRRVIVPYEIKKCLDNGEIDGYKN